MTQWVAGVPEKFGCSGIAAPSARGSTPQSSPPSGCHAILPAPAPSAKCSQDAPAARVPSLSVHHRPRRRARLNHDPASELLPVRKAWLLHRSLNVHVVIHHVRNKLRMRQRLIHSAHNPKADVIIPMLHERRNNRVKWPLASGERVRRLRIERKQPSPILQRKPLPFTVTFDPKLL